MRTIVMHDAGPPMSPWDAATLTAAGPFGPGEAWMAVDPNDIPYGASLVDLAADFPYLNHLLEAAAPAGRMGFCNSGITLLIRAAWLDLVSEAKTFELLGVDGDALGALDTIFFEQTVELLHGIIADLEDRAATLRRQFPTDRSDGTASPA
jgi:hypothetical protein